MVPARDRLAGRSAPLTRPAAAAGSVGAAAPAGQAALLMVGAALAFSLMAVAVKAASARYGAGEIVFYRAIVGTVVMAAVLRLRGIPLATTVPRQHLARSVSGTASLCLWFFSLGALPLATATTLNHTSSVWIALIVLGAHRLASRGAPSPRGDRALAAAVAIGFVGVALVLQPGGTQGQWLGAAAGLLSGLLAGIAYLQVQQLGRAGEPGARIVFYFSLAGIVAGLALALAAGGLTPHSAVGAAQLVAVGVFATIGQWALTRAYATGRAIANAALQYLGVVFSFGLGVWLFDDPVTAAAVAGMLLIVGAGIAASRLARAPGAA